MIQCNDSEAELPVFPFRPVTGVETIVDVEIKFLSLSHSVCIFLLMIMFYSDRYSEKFIQTNSKIVHLYVIQVYISELPCLTHTRSSWKWIPKYADCDIQKRMCNFSLQSTCSPLTFFNEQKLAISIIIHIITILFMLNW